jgi:hypothetical protein
MTKRDVFFLIIAGIGILLWFCFKRDLFALLLTIFVDSIGTYLTL